VLLDLGEGEAEPLRLPDCLDEAHGLLVVVAVAVGATSRLHEQPAPLVVAERLDVHPGAARDLSDPHTEATIDPYRGTDVKP
jgi:hypothetical protein